MIIIVESTDELVIIDGVKLRVWKGVTDGGVPCEAFIRGVGVAVSSEADLAGLEQEPVPEGIAGRLLPGGQ